MSWRTVLLQDCICDELVYDVVGSSLEDTPETTIRLETLIEIRIHEIKYRTQECRQFPVGAFRMNRLRAYDELHVQKIMLLTPYAIAILLVQQRRAVRCRWI